MKILFSFILFLYINVAFTQNKQISKSGDIIQLALPIVAFSSTLVDYDGYKPIIQFLESGTLSLVLTRGLKKIVNKKRPSGGDYSFPSGHTSCAFTGAAFLERRYGFKIGIPAYALASYVAFSRIKTNRHDWYDVGAGAAIGILSVYIFTKSKNKNLSMEILQCDKSSFLISAKYIF